MGVKRGVYDAINYMGMAYCSFIQRLSDDQVYLRRPWLRRGCPCVDTGYIWGHITGLIYHLLVSAQTHVVTLEAKMDRRRCRQGMNHVEKYSPFWG